jgi:Cupin-like domain
MVKQRIQQSSENYDTISSSNALRGRLPVASKYRGMSDLRSVHWLAVRKRLGHSDREIAEMLRREKRLSETEAKIEVEKLSDYCVSLAECFAKKAAKTEAILTLLTELKALCGREGSVDRASSLTGSEFLERYYSQNKPVLLTGFAREWPAVEKWCPEYFKSRFGSANIEVMADRNTGSDYEINRDRFRYAMTMEKYVELIEASAKTNNLYMVAHNRTLRLPEFKEIFTDIEFDSGMFSRSDAITKINLWFGPEGTVTPLHHDNKNVLLVQVYGKKRVILIPPSYGPFVYNEVGAYSCVDPEQIDLTRYPRFSKVRMSTVTIEAGDALFIPVAWWHHVRSESTSISLSLSNFIWLNEFKIPVP